jgi:glyceraldehyde-3-phosphate dehydrogenase/erythrose-4-phosphate dehydrogenase
MGTFPADVHIENNMLCINGKKIEIIAELDPRNINWKKRSIVGCLNQVILQSAKKLF